jgi:hypothetical protein
MKGSAQMAKLNCSARKYKLSLKKEASTRSLAQNEDLYQRHIEYQDHYIQQTTLKDDKLFLKHSQNMPSKGKKFIFTNTRSHHEV